jgi:hypothetical protein
MNKKNIVPVVGGYAYLKTLGLLVAVPVDFLPEGSLLEGFAELTYAELMSMFTEALNVEFPVFVPTTHVKCEVVNPEEGEVRGRYLKIVYRHPLALTVVVRILLPDSLLAQVEGKHIVLSGEKLNALLEPAIAERKAQLGR